MHCPSCFSIDYTCVLNTVHREDGAVRRRRGCRLCQIRWTTTECLVSGSLLKAFVPRPIVGTPRVEAADSQAGGDDRGS